VTRGRNISVTAFAPNMAAGFHNTLCHARLADLAVREAVEERVPDVDEGAVHVPRRRDAHAQDSRCVAGRVVHSISRAVVHEVWLWSPEILLGP